MARRARTLVVWFAAAATAAGCASSGGWLGNGGGAPRPPTVVVGSGETAAAGDALGVYLATLRDLLADDPVVQADAFSAAETAAQISETTTNRLNYALALATPGHAGSDAEAAQRLLGELLAESQSLLPEERILATDHLKHVEQRLILDAEARRLREQLTAATAARTDQTTRQLQSALEENRRLQAELNEALERLDAITNIERSIRERDNGPTAD